jgi:hypothetical protein
MEADNPATRGPGGAGEARTASSGTIYAGAETMAKPDYLFKSLVIGDSGVTTAVLVSAPATSTV